MQKKTLIFLIVLLLNSLGAMSQNLYLTPRVGLGTFSMKSMKEWQQQAISSTDVNAKATNTFPPYLQFGIGLQHELDENTLVGIFLEHGSSGGRIAYQDYSGEFTIDDLMSYNAVGASISSHRPVSEASELHFLAGIELNAFFSKLVHKEKIQVYGESDESEDIFKAIGVGVKPFVGLQYPIGNYPLSLSAGYLLSGSGAFHVPGEPDYKLSHNQRGDGLEPSWSGLRLNVSLSIPILK